MRRTHLSSLFAAAVAASLVLTACTGSDDDPAPTETETTTDGASETESETETEEPSETESATETEDPTDDPTEGSTDDETEPASEEPAPSASGNAVPTSTSTVSVDASNSVFAPLADEVREVSREAGCPVVPAVGETITTCVSGFSRSQGDRESVVTVSTTGGTESIRVYDFDATRGWVSSLIAQPGQPIESVSRAAWAGFDDAFVVRFGSSHEVITTDAAAGSRVGGVFSTSLGTIGYQANRVIVRPADSSRIQIYTPPAGAGGFAGTESSTTSGVLAEDVALRVYAAWVSGNPASAAEYLTDAALSALQKAPQSADAFEMVGNTCSVADGVATCQFRRGGAVTTWDIRPIDGAMKVFRLR